MPRRKLELKSKYYMTMQHIIFFCSKNIIHEKKLILTCNSESQRSVFSDFHSSEYESNA